MNITEKNCAAAILNAIGALAEKLTGMELHVKLSDDEGNFIWIRPTLSHTRWVKAPEPLVPSDHPGGTDPMQTELRHVSDGIPQRPRQSDLQ